MYPYVNYNQPNDYRFGAGIGWWPFLGGLAGGFAGGLLGGAFSSPRPLPPRPYGYPEAGFPGGSYLPPAGYPGANIGGYPGAGIGGYPGAGIGGYPGAGIGGYPGAGIGGYPGAGIGGYPGSVGEGYPALGGAGYQDNAYPFVGYSGLDSVGSGTGYPPGARTAYPKFYGV
ncbi:hypothetical protein DYI25_15830 [Mesobacillus boroniphilus]|uniref:Uncharacterized protein n=1 Tax=Mesobacillus boroniphilus TaxID=308892 RepID=A0A944GYV1_9BACI|nr:hypothetical protein [Mesobacillus boroniphilus]MBS8265896.1 hypothetical protein [Mesobacillus boroniphilus]